LRTSNVVESPFATVRLRTTATRRFKKVKNATALIWKLLQVAEVEGVKGLPAQARRDPLDQRCDEIRRRSARSAGRGAGRDR
jgi:hypothetical protein